VKNSKSAKHPVRHSGGPAKHARKEGARDNQLRALQRELAAAPLNLVTEGVDAIIEVQKSSLVAATHYGEQAIELWKKAFWFVFGAPSEEAARELQQGKLLPWRAEPGEQSRARRGTKAA
jgi:hypothetical protein